MEEHDNLKSATEIIDIATKAHNGTRGETTALPLPTIENGSVVVSVLFYTEGLQPDTETLFPPHGRANIEAERGNIIEVDKCVPSDFNVPHEAGVPIDGFGLDHVTADEFWERMDRFQDISADVWQLYAEGNTQLEPEAQDLVREYFTCYQRIAKAPLIPYYEAIAGDFFRWIEKVLA